jgi:hypothetical protein
MSKTAIAPYGIRQDVNLLQISLFVLCNHHLADAVAVMHGEI